MTSLRSKLIRLAHSHPEFRDDLLPLLKTGSGIVGQDKETQAAALKALNALLEEVKAPVKWSSVNENSKEIPVPKGFDSLFKSVHIVVKWNSGGESALVKWSYDHPRGGNGYDIGTIGVVHQKTDPETGKGPWGWQTDEGRWGIVE
jgi:hypothetical protein